jgi:hypothetical protein
MLGRQQSGRNAVLLGRTCTYCRLLEWSHSEVSDTGGSGLRERNASVLLWPPKKAGISQHSRSRSVFVNIEQAPQPLCLVLWTRGVRPGYVCGCCAIATALVRSFVEIFLLR